MDTERIAAYLRSKMPDARDLSVENLARIPGGASRETYMFDARWSENGGATVERAFILRRDPPASLLDSNIDLEFELYTALAESGIPVPRVHWLDREGAIERPFYVMERLPGATDARTLVLGPEWADVRPEIIRQKATILAKIHQFDIVALPGLERPASPADCGTHEIERWARTMRADTLEPQPVLEMALSWLRRHLPPPPDRLRLVHADYRTGNFLYDRSGITGVLDWEMAHAGDPIEDIAWVCVKSWRWAGDERVGGLCDRDEFIRLYEEAGGVKVDRDALKFWEVLGNLKLAVIFISGTKSIVQGKTPDLLLALTAFINPGIEAEIMELIA